MTVLSQSSWRANHRKKFRSHLVFPRELSLGQSCSLSILTTCRTTCSTAHFLFADDSIIYREIKCKQDAQKLQSDLEAAGRW
ncbi:hypothetical protein DPMN_032968 [Dreissena polymorpha]|uniref:Uncharacterized protein n=1 Tax=Dreissena polymorpha TaxID=45954 RepID=A0A9D4M2T8_DREPO|nr:hypothetical protein DPMN_032968 [Dreissena polymorpha]